MSAGGGPLTAVLAELEAGAPTLDDVARRTGLDRELVAAVVDQLVRLGRISALPLSSTCPASGCGGCAVSGCGQGQRWAPSRVVVVQARASR